jgi:hypothetical protein
VSGLDDDLILVTFEVRELSAKARNTHGVRTSHAGQRRQRQPCRRAGSDVGCFVPRQVGQSSPNRPLELDEIDIPLCSLRHRGDDFGRHDGTAEPRQTGIGVDDTPDTESLVPAHGVLS